MAEWGKCVHFIWHFTCLVQRVKQLEELAYQISLHFSLSFSSPRLSDDWDRVFQRFECVWASRNKTSRSGLESAPGATQTQPAGQDLQEACKYTCTHTHTQSYKLMNIQNPLTQIFLSFPLLQHQEVSISHSRVQSSSVNSVDSMSNSAP